MRDVMKLVCPLGAAVALAVVVVGADPPPPAVEARIRAHDNPGYVPATPPADVVPARPLAAGVLLALSAGWAWAVRPPRPA